MALFEDDKDPPAKKPSDPKDVQKLVMDILEATINDWESQLTTEEGLKRLREKDEDEKKPQE